MDLPGGGKTLGDDVTLTVHVELVKEMRGSSAGEAKEAPVS